MMRKMSIKTIKPGMVLAKSVYSPNGNLMLVGGSQLTASYLTKIREIGYSAAFIKEKYSEHLEAPEFLSDEQRIEFIKKLALIFSNAQRTRQIDTGMVKGIVNTIVDEAVVNRGQMFELPDIRPSDWYIYGHSINVCLMSIRLGILLGYNELQLRDLGVGALLHDIGRIFLPQDSENKGVQEKAKNHENERKHVLDGFNLMREHKDINLLSCHVVYQHHEQVDGGGYPRNLAGSEICEYARIVAIANMFDTLTSDYMNRKSYPLHEAIFLMKKEAGKKLDQELLNLFLRCVAAFPTGSLVELDNGQVCVVSENILNNSFRPKVNILTDAKKRILGDIEELDLRAVPDRQIVKVIAEDDPIVFTIRREWEKCM